MTKPQISVTKTQNMPDEKLINFLYIVTTMQIMPYHITLGELCIYEYSHKV